MSGYAARARTRKTFAPEHAAAMRRPARAESGGARWDLSHVPALPAGVQAKLTIGAVNDPAEAEADQVADQVMRGAEAAPAGSAEPGVQRACSGCGDEEIQRLPIVQRAGDGAAAAGGPASAGAEAAVGGLGGGAPLAPAERDFFEPRFGRDLSGVRVHDGAAADTASRAMSARAFTLGSDIAFARGEYRPGTSEGRRLMAHELVHTIQQGDGARRQVQRVSEEQCASPGVCDFRDGTGTATGKYSITIYADKEGPFLLIPVTSGVGHAWLRLEDDKGNYYTYGFWPKTGFDPANSRADVDGCVHTPDKAHTPTSSQTFEISAAQFDAAFDYAKTTCLNRPKYNLFSYNCTSFVTEALSKAGQGSYGGFGLIWESPQSLDKWLRVHALQIGLNVTAATSTPGAGPSASFDFSYRHQFYSLLGSRLRLYGVGAAELGSPVKTLGAGVGVSLDPEKVYLPAFYMEGLGTLGDMNAGPNQDKFGAGFGGAAGLRYNIDMFGSVGIEYNVLKDVVNKDPALSRMMFKLGFNLW
jgi:Domain of unknown function (DUF4157)